MTNALVTFLLGVALGTWVSRRRAVGKAVAAAKAEAAAESRSQSVVQIDGRSLSLGDYRYHLAAEHDDTVGHPAYGLPEFGTPAAGAGPRGAVGAGRADDDGWKVRQIVSEQALRAARQRRASMTEPVEFDDC